MIHMAVKKPRKILGSGNINNVNYSFKGNYNNSNLNINRPLNQPEIQPLINNNSKYPDLSTAPSELTLMQHYELSNQMERMHLANMIFQEKFTTWKDSAMIPAPNIASINMESNLSPNSYQYRNNNYFNIGTTNTHISSDLNKIKTHIKMQSISQKTQQNFNSTTDSREKVQFTNSPLLNQQAIDKNCNKMGGTIYKEKEKRFASVMNSNDAWGVSTNVNSTMHTLSKSMRDKLTSLALCGGTIAEKLAFSHRSRPCFKKMDSLCARMKQDLLRPNDNILANINSQGLAWVVKDFIFILTRLVTAWVTVKGYVYNLPESLNELKSAFTPNFFDSFESWQFTTIFFMENVINSLINVDNLMQLQKNIYQKTGNDVVAHRVHIPTMKLLHPINNIFLKVIADYLTDQVENNQKDLVNKNYLSPIVEDSENKQRQAILNGTYFKTGTYKPIKKGNLNQCTPSLDNCNNNVKSNGTFIITPPNYTEKAIPKSIPISVSKYIFQNDPPLNQQSGGIFESNLRLPAKINTTKTCIEAKYSNRKEIRPFMPLPNTNTTKLKRNVNGTIITATTNNFSDNIVAFSNNNIGAFNNNNFQNSNNVNNIIKDELSVVPLANRHLAGVDQNLNSPQTSTTTNNAVSFKNTNFQNNDVNNSTSPTQEFEKGLKDKLNIIIERLMSMESAELFFKLQFTENYFPDFIAKHKRDFMDVRSIILKYNVGGYHHIYEVVHDIKKIIFACKEFLKIKNDIKLKTSMIAFETELNQLLNEPPFHDYHFDHITGESKQRF